MCVRCRTTKCEWTSTISSFPLERTQHRILYLYNFHKRRTRVPKKKTNFLLSHLFVCVLVPVLHTNNLFQPLAFRTNVFYIFISMFLRSPSVLCNCYCPSCTLLLSCIFVQYTRTIVIWMGIEINYMKYIIYIHIHINICM